MHSRLGIASFVLALVVAAGYIVVRVLLLSPGTFIAALWINLGFIAGAAVLGLLGLVLGILGWIRAGRSGRKNGFAILGTALDLAIVVWVITAAIMAFTTPIDATTT